MWRAVPLLLVLALAACGGASPTPTERVGVVTATLPQGSPPPTAAATVAVAATAIPNVPSSTVAASAPDAAAMVQRLRAAGFPIEAVTVWTADNDPNKLLGRPNQYTSKATFRDTRLPATTDPSIEAGGDIEVFANDADLQVRKTSLEKIIQSSSIFTQYLYTSNLAILRLSKSLVPAQATQYQSTLALASGNTASAPSIAPIPNATRTVAASVPTVVPTAVPAGKVGERIAGQGFAVTLHAVQDPAPPAQFGGPKGGYRFVAVEVTIENTGASQFYAQPFDVHIKDAENREYIVAVGSAEPRLNNSQIAPGEATRGWVNFEILQNVAIASVNYAPQGNYTRVNFQIR